MRHHAILTGVIAGAIFLPAFAAAQSTFEVLHRFEPGATSPIGRLTEGPDGSLYGLAYRGGPDSSGGVYVLRRTASGGWAQQTLHMFRRAVDGAKPWGSLTLGSDGYLYGSTTDGGLAADGSTGYGTIFRMTTSGTVSVLHTLTGSEGTFPVWHLREASDGNFYGSTCEIDTKIFRITRSGFYETVFRFGTTGRTWQNGACPVTELEEGADGFLYGQATYAGPVLPWYTQYGAGSLFRVDPRASSPTPFSVLFFFSGQNGAQPVGGFVSGPGGALYGSAYEGGPFGKGLIFRREASGQVTTVHAFEGDDGAKPYGSLLRGADGALYGAATEGGTGFGTLFKIDAQGLFSRLHAFNGADGRTPVELTQALDGGIYGATYNGGSAGAGSVFRLAPGGAFESVHSFSSPGGPVSGVIEASDGNLYGTTSNTAAVFRFTSAGELSVVHDLETGTGPSGLVQATDGFLYGTTFMGGSQGLGTVFRVSIAGDFAVVHSFTSPDQRYPQNGVMQASDGLFYGTTLGGNSTTGTVFRMDSAGDVTTLHTLVVDEGHDPSSLVEGADGNIYGTLVGNMPGNPNAAGSIFKVSKTGAFTFVHVFPNEEGFPRGGLIRAADGRLYGVTSVSIFRVETGGSLTTLHSFTIDDGLPDTIVEGRDGALYVTTRNVGLVMLYRKIFRFTPAGLTILYVSAPDVDGDLAPYLIQRADGALYGTIRAQPSSDPGAFLGGIFRLTFTP